jgi:two-component system response regulator YesN
MFKLLIVDDEEIEREGMAKFIPWEKYDIELVGTAWNGVDAFEKVQSKKPDIILTDIKMPVMDGIELIQKVITAYPNTKLIVLSGYGEFEYTSRAMEYGIRHYILKPCDEEHIMKVMNEVKAELEKERTKKQMENKYHYTIRKLLPRARDEIFRNMLLEREQISQDYELFMEEIGNKNTEVLLLGLRNPDRGFDYLDQFVIGNVMKELLGDYKILLTTAIQNDLLLLVEADAEKALELVVSRTRQEYKRVRENPFYSAVSRKGNLQEVCILYEQIKGLFRMRNIEKLDEYLHYSQFKSYQNQASSLFNYKKLQYADNYEEIIFEVYLAFVKMKLNAYGIQQKKEICNWVMKILYEEEVVDSSELELQEKKDDWGMLEQMVDRITERNNCALQLGKENKRIRMILIAIYQNLHNTELNIQYLAREVLYMNEDYFSRLFVKKCRRKFSTFLLEVRIGLAKNLLQYNPEMKISELTELLGYSSDGQYFSKTFKKLSNMTPTEYRDLLRQEGNEKL